MEKVIQIEDYEPAEEYKKIPKQKTKSMIRDFSDRIKEMGTNMKFNWTNKHYTLKENDEVTLLGQTITVKARCQVEAKTKMLYALFTNIVWISYRKNFPPLLPSLCGSEFISDTGWGCMIRVGQMMFAQALKKHIFFDYLNPEENEKFIIIPKQELKKIICGFLDDDQGSNEIAPYSIQKIAKSSFEEFKHKPGEWYNPSNINYTLEKLHNSHRLKGAEHLEILISNEGMVFLDKMLAKIEHEKCDCDWEKKLDKSLNGSSANKKNKDEFFLIKDLEELKKSESEIIRKISCDESQSSNEMIENQEEEKKNNSLSDSYESLNLEDTVNLTTETQPCKYCKSTKKSLFYVIMIQIGLEAPGLNYLEIVGKLMKSQYSVGMVGGKPSSALYFVGLHRDNFLFLDPHYVQSSANVENIDLLLDTFFCENTKSMKTKNISPSLGLGFYFRNPLEIKNFYYFLKELSKNNEDSFFLGLEKSSVEYDDFKVNVNFMKDTKTRNLSNSWELIE